MEPPTGCHTLVSRKPYYVGRIDLRCPTFFRPWYTFVIPGSVNAICSLFSEACAFDAFGIDRRLRIAARQVSHDFLNGTALLRDDFCATLANTVLRPSCLQQLLTLSIDHGFTKTRLFDPFSGPIV